MKKCLEISFYTCALKIIIRWCLVCEIRCVTDGARWMDRQKKWNIQVGTPPKNSDVYKPTVINNLIYVNNQTNFMKIIKQVTDEGLPFNFSEFSIYHLKLHLSSHHPAVHFLWKQLVADASWKTAQLKLIHNLKSQSKTYYTSAMKIQIWTTILKIGIVKHYQANFIMKELLELLRWVSSKWWVWKRCTRSSQHCSWNGRRGNSWLMQEQWLKTKVWRFLAGKTTLTSLFDCIPFSRSEHCLQMTSTFMLFYTLLIFFCEKK